MQLQKLKNIETTDQYKIPKNWHPGMGDYVKNNSQEDSKGFRKKVLKNKLLITILILTQIGILLGAFIFFLDLRL